MTVPELAKMISIPSSDVLRHLAAMKKKGRMEMVGHEGQYPLFTAVGKGGCA
jgi:DNA-binding IclR family transcriptional regulator